MHYIVNSIQGIPIAIIESLTLESRINVLLCLIIFGVWSRGYGLITDLKDLNFTI